MSERRVLRVLIVDDEPLGVARIAELLREQAEVELVGTAEDGDAAIDAIRGLRPDLVFLDVQMPRKSGLDVVWEVGPQEMPATVFVTAYDQFALQAFEIAAVDYLVKPFDDDRFEEAFRRARHKLDLDELDRLRDRMLTLLQTDSGRRPHRPGEAFAESAATSSGPEYRERFAVRSKGKLRVVPVSRIDYITASGSYTELHTGAEVHLIRESMQALEEQLDPNVFIRVHRSAIVRLDLIDLLLRGSGGDYAVQLKGGTRLPVGRSKLEALEARLGRG